MFSKEKKLGQFTEQAQVALQLARLEAQQLQHEYIGTEHILLGLMKEPSGLAVSVLKTFHVDAAMVQAEIEKLVQRGAKPVTLPQFPYTPRAQQALAYAVEEARFWNQESIGPEHLLLGLLREGEGVAGQVLRSLGLVLHDVVREVVKTRLAQMQAVERAVRPVRTTTAHKRKMREELLAHLTAVYDEEFARSKNPATALQEAQKRFGEPAELARELDAAVPLNERIGYHFERWLGWRAPESAARYMLRQATLSFCLLAIACAVIAGGTVLLAGWNRQMWETAVRAPMAFLIMTPVAQFVIGLLYYKMRDALYGPPWAKRSPTYVAVFAAPSAVASFAAGAAFIAASTWEMTRVVEALFPLGCIAVAIAVVLLVLARVYGPSEIRETLWASLSLNGAAFDGTSTPGQGGSSVEPA